MSRIVLLLVWIAVVYVALTVMQWKGGSSSVSVPTHYFRSKEGHPRPPTVSVPHFVPLARSGDLMNLSVLVLDNVSKELLTPPLAFHNIPFDEASLNAPNFKIEREVSLEACVRRNCTVLLHATWTLRNTTFTLKAPHAMLQYRPLESKPSRRLLPQFNAATPQNITEFPYQVLWQPRVTLGVVVDFSMPQRPEFNSFTPLLESPDGSRSLYGPAVFVHNFYVLRKHLMPVNASSVDHSFPLSIEVCAVTLWKALFYHQMESSLSMQQSTGLATEGSTEELKEIFLENHPGYLALTFTIAVLHSVFATLAFHNDVQFWKSRKNYTGISLRTLLLTCYSETVVFLYLLEDSNTSWVVRIPTGLGVLTAYWSVFQTLRWAWMPLESTGKSFSDPMEMQPYFRVRIAGYEICLGGAHDSKTNGYDETAVRYLMWCLTPLLCGYAAYSACFHSFSGWYHFCLHTQVQFIYFFGFALMTPQIFINYQMKSVGQLPWRTFVYKALNTVIDDFFSFAVPMPFLHRMACFRDDVVFVVLLYQRWLYPVDELRRFGEGDVEMAGDATPEGEVRLAERPMKSNVALKVRVTTSSSEDLEALLHKKSD